MFTFVVIIHIIACLVLILVILLQAGSGGGIADIFGGGGGMPTILGTQAPDFLKKLTAICAILFLVTCTTLVVLSRGRMKSLIKETADDPALQQVIPTDTANGVPGTVTDADGKVTETLDDGTTRVTEAMPDGSERITETSPGGQVKVTTKYPRALAQKAMRAVEKGATVAEETAGEISELLPDETFEDDLYSDVSVSGAGSKKEPALPAVNE